MSLEYIRHYYSVPAKAGGRVEYTGDGKPRGGKIVAAAGARLKILLDGERLPGYFHPTWELRYLNPALKSGGA